MKIDDGTQIIIFDLFQTKIETAKYIDIGGLRIYPKDPLFKELQGLMIDYILKEKGKLV